MGDIEIRSGGVVAVDTESLRAATARLDALGREIDAAAGLFHRAAAQIAGVPRTETVYAESRALFLATRAAELADSSRSLGGRLGDLAALYEAIELRSSRAAAEVRGDEVALARIDARIDALERSHPWTQARAWWSESARDALWGSDLVAQTGLAFGGLGPLGVMGTGALAAVFWGALRSAETGVIARAERMTGASDPVRIRPVPAGLATAPDAAPVSLAAAAARIPAGESARVRVERYTMPDGSRQFAVYVRGTTSSGFGGRDAFDAKSNLELYGGAPSASYTATLAALRESGAEPGDVVHAFGHSQGAMVASWLAVEGGYDTRTLVTFGSPVEAEVGSETLSVAVRHTDDPVAALQGGGLDTGTGAAGSFVAERSADPMPGVDDVALGAHHLTTYEQTAAMLDASADPRMGAVREVFAELGGAASVDVTEYAATRVSASDAGAG